ncbi:hypothetical protein N9Q94_02605 [Flavobacteriaceae bacterium]|nr:hypothetical protein [Flavobacteriaceae bacterium]
MNQKRITNQILEQKNYTLNSTLNYLFNISNMKKLFSYLLISSMVVLSSCTNYDDQFDDLNTQINTLKSQIEGFSSLSSGLTALQGTVASLQTAIANIPVTPATDISGLESTQATLTAALTSLAADVKALQDTLATAATAAEVAALQTALTAAQSDLTELLAANNVFTPSGVFKITTPAELTFAESLAGKVGIINGDITVTQSSTMDATKLAAVLAKITTVTGDVIYTASGTSVTPTAGFTKLASVTDLTVDADGDISFPALASAGKVLLTTNAKTTNVSFPVLASVTSLGGAAFGDHTLSFTGATGFDMGALTRYSATTLSITTKDGLTNLDALQILAEDGTTKQITDLTVNGATELSIDALTRGEISANKITSVDFPIWEGDNASRFAKATTVVLPKITANAASATYDVTAMFPNASSVHIIGASTSISTTAKAFISVDVLAHTDLTTLILDGELNEVDIQNSADISSITFTGTAKDVTIHDTAATSIDLGYTAGKVGASGVVSVAKNGKLDVQDNEDMTSLSADKLDDIALTVKSNSSLTAISFDALDSVGTHTNISVDISGNDLVIDNVQQGTAASVVPVVKKVVKSADFGPLQKYLDAAIAKVGTTGKIYVVADDVLQSTSILGVVTEDPSGDTEIVNYDPSVKDNSTGGKAEVNEYYVTALSTNGTLAVGDYTSTITDAASVGVYFDLANWAAQETVMANYETAGVDIAVGKGTYEGKITVAGTLNSTTLSPYYEFSAGGTNFSGTIGADTDYVALSLVNDIFEMVNTNTRLTAIKEFDLSTTTTAVVFKSASRGSNARTFSIGNFKTYESASKTTPVTTATATTSAPAQLTDEGYVRVTSRVKGIAGIATPTVGSALVALTASGTYTGASATADDAAIATAENGTTSTVTAADIKAARVDMTEFLAS